MTRPRLKKGDLVKLHKNRYTTPAQEAGVKLNTMYRVMNITFNIEECNKLRVRRRWQNSSEGFASVVIQNTAGTMFSIRRRLLWRVPNQPRYKKSWEELHLDNRESIKKVTKSYNNEGFLNNLTNKPDLPDSYVNIRTLE